MKKLCSIIMSIVCVLSILTVNDITVSAKAGKVNSYYDMLTYKNNTIYLKDYEDGSGAICQFTASTGKVKAIVSEKKGIYEMCLSGSTLYYTTIDSKANFVTYSISVTGKNKKKIDTGMLMYADSKYVVYSNDTVDKMNIYTKNLSTGTVTKVFETKAYMDYVKTIGDTLYFYKYEMTPNRIKMYTMKTNSTKMTLVTTDQCSKDESYYIHAISDVIKLNGNIYYQYGCFQGTGNFWYGNMMRIDSKGKKNTIAKGVEVDTFAYDSTNIHYNSTTSGSKFVAYNVKTAKKTTYKMTLTENQMYDILGSRTYLVDFANKKTVTVSRFQSGTDKKNLRKNFIKIPFTQNKKYSYYGEVRKVGSSYIVGITTMDFSDMDYGWRGKEVAVNWYVADANGKVIGSFH